MESGEVKEGGQSRVRNTSSMLCRTEVNVGHTAQGGLPDARAR